MRKLWLFLVLLPVMSRADQIFFSSPSYINPTTLTCVVPYPSSCSKSALSQNIKRGYLLLQNTSTANAYFSLGAPQSASGSFILAAGGSYEPFVAPASQLFLLVPTGSGVVVMEGNN